MKCKHCDGTGTTNWCINGTFVDCPYCGGTGEIEVEMTEQEYIQTCNTEQLAEWIAKIVDCDCCPVKRKFCDDNPCKIRFAEWLKKPHKPIS